jgi:hypothetical protein
MLKGVPHIVLPATILVEGVHNALFYPAEELQSFVQTWNGVPIPINHPEIDGVPVSANDPKIINDFVVGNFFGAFYDETDKAIKGEAWLDTARLTKISPGTLSKIQSGKIIELSTGLFLDEDNIEGMWNGEDYYSTARNYRPDHLALLPAAVGACSIQDGCGLGVNEQEDNKDSMKQDQKTDVEKLEGVEDLANNETPKKLFGIFSKLASLFKFKTHEISYGDIREKIQSQLSLLDVESEQTITPGKYHWVEEVFDNYIVFATYSEGQEPVMFRQDYQINDDKPELVGEPTPVEMKREYVEVNGNAKTIDSNKQTMEENKNMCCEKKVTALIENKETQFEEADREWLMMMEEEQLDKMVPKVKEPDVNAKEPESVETIVNEELKINEENKKVTVTFEEILANAGEYKEMIEDSVGLYREKRKGLIGSIMKNKRNPYTQEELEGKDMKELGKLAALAVEADYSGNAPKETVEVQANERKEDGSGVPDVPKMKWSNGKPVFDHV